MQCDEQDFVSGIEEIAEILRRLEPPTSSLLQAVDAKGQDYATYYFAAFSDTGDIERSLNVYRYVRDLVRIIVLMDRYFEVGNERYRRRGRALVSRLRNEDGELLRNIIDFNMKQFWPFWKYEQHTRKLMMHGHLFSVSEAKCFNLFKSSDAAIIYAPLLEGLLTGFEKNASLIMHYNQALQDIEDDLDDIQEDLRDQMPNIFILASVGRDDFTSYTKLQRHKTNGSKAAIIERATSTILGIVDMYLSAIDGIEVPESLKFLKHLSRHYARRIRNKLESDVRTFHGLAAAQS